MIISTENGDILQNSTRRVAFPINVEGINDTGFAGIISRRFWPELAHVGRTERGEILIKRKDGYEFFALCCRSMHDCWYDQKETIKKCFDKIPGDAPICSLSIGEGFLVLLSGADSKQIKAGMEESQKAIILYAPSIYTLD